MRIFVKFPAIALLSLAATAFAQDTGTVSPAPPNPSSPNPIVTLASQFFERDFFNVFAYGSGVWDSYAPIYQNGNYVNNGSLGFEVGGGVDTFHAFRNGEISLSYTGAYRQYQSNLYGSGTFQNLALSLTKQLTRRWSFSWTAGAGIYLYGGSFLTAEPTTVNTVVTNPFSAETRFVSSGISMSYRQTRHLSYSFSGAFSVQRYNVPTWIGSTGGSGSASVQYQFKPRTSISGSYTHSYFVYEHGVGNASVDGFYGSLTHTFPDRWVATLSGGVARSVSSGTISVPVTVEIAPGEEAGGYLIGHYRQTVYIPSFSGSLSHNFHRYLLTVTAGQGVAPSGNGYFLNSKTDYVNGVVSRSFRRSNISAGGSYYRLVSIANTVTASYETGSLSFNYGVTVARHVGAFARYDFLRYGSLSPFNAVTDNRISFGVNFSSKTVPMTLF